MTNESRRGISVALLLASITATVCGAQAPPGERPQLRSIGSLSNELEFGHGKQVILRAIVTLKRSRTLYVQDQTGALPVHPVNAPPLALGDEVELHGVYGVAGSPGVLEQAEVRRLWAGSTPVPLSLKPEQAAEGAYNYHLVETEGRLLKKIVSGGYFRLLLEGDRQVFAATLELSSPFEADSHIASRIEEGSVLRLTGVCAPSPNQNDEAAGAFMVLLRSVDDIRVVGPPPWWSPRHIALVALGMAVLLLALYRLRIRFLRQQFQAVVEERLRIAREMHDTLAQGFAGLTYQLEGLSLELGQSKQGCYAAQHLTLALHLVRHSREEAHRSIYALRSLTQDNPDLLKLLTASVDFMVTASGIKLTAISEGKPLAVSDEAINNLLRIGQEAVTNAVRHAKASEIRIKLQFARASLHLEIQDNGQGFDVEQAHSVDTGHFGIMGMKERAESIDAGFRMDSSVAKGTTVSVRVAAKVKAQRYRPVGLARTE